MKKIFITSFHPLISRNILQTEILSLLLQKKIYIYIFCHDYKKDYFNKQFAEPGVEIIGIKQIRMTAKELLLKQFCSNFLPTNTLKIHRKEKYTRDKKLFSFLISIFFLNFLSKIKLIGKLFRFIFIKSYRKNIYGEYFKKYNPDLIFTTDVFQKEDIEIMVEAKKNKIKTIGMIRSWDNITNKGLMPILPDKLIVHNQIIKNEAVFYENIKPEKIFISGIPQFDYYLNKKRTPKEEFFKKIGFSLDKKVITFAPQGRRFHSTDWCILQFLHDSIINRKIKGQPQLIVKYPPGDDMETKYLQLSNQVKIYFSRPGVHFGDDLKLTELNRQNMVELADILAYSDVVLNYGSTIIIDASAFDKPVIFLAFDCDKELPYLKSVKRFSDYEHIGYLTRSKACRIANNKQELLQAINLYLADNNINRDKRALLIKEQCWQFDGRSSKRIANCLINNLNL